MPRKRLTAQDAFMGVREGVDGKSQQRNGGSQESGVRSQENDKAEERQGVATADDEATAERQGEAGKETSRGAEEHLLEHLEELVREAAEEEAADQDTESEKRVAAMLSKRFVAAMRRVQEDAAAKGPVERLTLYLPPDVAGQLSALWSEMREATQLKIGKSVIAGAALRMVLRNPRLRANVAIIALREKMGERL
jgi:hypothetical protein